MVFLEQLPLFAVALFLLAFGSISGRIDRTVLTPPMLFVLFGILIGNSGLHWLHVEKDHPLIHLLAELTLVLVLFTDAARVDVKRLKHDHNIPVRMLLIGLPLCMLFGALAALPLFPHLGIWSAMVLGVVLAPTDAALGQAVVSSDRVPLRIRQALNVESGLNDGMALPVLLFFICLAMRMENVDESNFLITAAQQMIVGTLIGIAVGYVGGRLVSRAHAAAWMNHEFVALSAIGLAILAYAGAELLGGNGFIGAFVAGVALGNTITRPCGIILLEFGETEGQFLTLLTFLFFGALMVPPALPHINGPVLLYTLLSLTVVRIVPVALSLLGLNLNRGTLFFLGWFGPRGIATIIYGMLLLKEGQLEHREELFNIAVTVVLASVFVHGFSAWPAVQWYDRLIHKSMTRPEHEPAHLFPLRLGNRKKGRDDRSHRPKLGETKRDLG